MNRSLFTGLSGTMAYQSSLDVIGNNIVNANTPGYKEGRSIFKDVFYDTIKAGSAASGTRGGSNPSQIGSGVAVGAIQVAMTQGATQQTGQPLDAAVDGAGFFVLNGANGHVYTREGAFSLDDANTLVSANTGLQVQGWVAQNGVIDPTGALTALKFPLGDLRAPQATGAMLVTGNLDATAATGDIAPAGIAVNDSLGQTHQVSLTFTKNAAVNSWQVTATCGADTATGTATFGPTGALTGGSPLALALHLATGATTPQTVNVDLSRLSQLAEASSAVVQSQDGFAAASLVGVELADGGEVIGRYSDGATKPLAQVALASFANAAGLQREGNNLYASSVASGGEQTGAPATGGRGNIVARSLELSNVDLTKSFVDMVTTQRAFQASASVISTANQMLQDALQITQR
ncbi:MAG TPA: flagellar hook protein FlgE [Armatimonadota bacterium]|jgi:flagellar hook protein FlgE